MKKKKKKGIEKHKTIFHLYKMNIWEIWYLKISFPCVNVIGINIK